MGYRIASYFTNNIEIRKLVRMAISTKVCWKTAYLKGPLTWDDKVIELTSPSHWPLIYHHTFCRAVNNPLSTSQVVVVFKLYGVYIVSLLCIQVEFKVDMLL